jgi:hypothetical protein
LFLNCLQCGQRNMTAKDNLDPRRRSPEYPPEQLCDTCYMRKHKLSVVCISMSFPRDGR